MYDPSKGLLTVLLKVWLGFHLWELNPRRSETMRRFPTIPTTVFTVLPK